MEFDTFFVDAKKLIESAMKATGLDVEALAERLGYKSLKRAMWGEIPLPESKRRHIEDIVRLHELQTQGSFATKTVVRERGEGGDEDLDVDMIVQTTPRGKLQDALRAAKLTPSALAKKMGYSQGAMENIVNGSGRISARMAEDLEKALEGRVTKEDLLAGSDMPAVIDQSGITGTRGGTPNITLPPNRKARLVPLLSMVQAGKYDIAHSDEMYEHAGALAIDTNDRQAFAVEIEGDSMTPRLNPGDIVICTPNSTPRVGQTVVIQTVEGQAFCKIWQRVRPDGVMVFASVNPDHRAFEIPRSEVAWIYPVDSAIQKFH